MAIPQLEIVDVKGIPVDRRHSVEAAITAAGSCLSEHHEAWVVPARRPPAYAVRITGPRGFYREIQFRGRETEAEICDTIRQAIAG